MMSLWDALRMNMMISYQELVRTFLNFDKFPLKLKVGYSICAFWMQKWNVYVS